MLNKKKMYLFGNVALEGKSKLMIAPSNARRIYTKYFIKKENETTKLHI